MEIVEKSEVNDNEISDDSISPKISDHWKWSSKRKRERGRKKNERKKMLT